MKRVRIDRRCPECGGPMAELLVDEALEYAAEVGQMVRARFEALTGLRIMRGSTYQAQERNAFQLGREVGREEGGKRHLQSV